MLQVMFTNVTKEPFYIRLCLNENPPVQGGGS